MTKKGTINLVTGKITGDTDIEEFLTKTLMGETSQIWDKIPLPDIGVSIILRFGDRTELDITALVTDVQLAWLPSQALDPPEGPKILKALVQLTAQNLALYRAGYQPEDGGVRILPDDRGINVKRNDTG
jgi:hypothetical protein